MPFLYFTGRAGPRHRTYFALRPMGDGYAGSTYWLRLSGGSSAMSFR